MLITSSSRRPRLPADPLAHTPSVPAEVSAMTFAEVVAELRAKHPKAALSPSILHGSAFTRAARINFKKDKGGMYSGRDADRHEVLVYFNDTADVIACTEMEPDLGPDEE